MKEINEVANKASMPCNKPRPSTRPGKKMMVKACESGREKIVHFGAKGYGHNYSVAARRSFRARHRCGEKKSKLSAQYWACKKLWAGKGGSKKSCPKTRQCKEDFQPNINILSEHGEPMRNFVRNLYEKKLTAGEMKAREKIVKGLKGKTIKPYRGRTATQSMYAIATAAAKRIAESRDIRNLGNPRKGKARTGELSREGYSRLSFKRALMRKKLKAIKESYISEEIVNSDNVPMSKSEIDARNKCYKSGKVKPGPTLKGKDSPSNSVARKCTYIVLRSTRGGAGGATKKGAFKAKGKKKKKTIRKKEKK